MDFEVVPVTEALIPGVHAALGEVARERRYLALLEAPPLEDSTAWIQAGLRRGSPHFAALSEGRVVGWCDITPIARPVQAHCGVLGIGVVAAHRGRGIGRALLVEALGKARDIGLTRVELSVREKNTSAIALYENLGFRREGRQQNAVRVDGAYGHYLTMALLFDAPGADAP